MTNLLLGIDIGTSGCKTAVFDTDGKIIASSTKPYEVISTKEGYAEQNPEEWYNAVCKALGDILPSIDASKIVGIGVDGQSWSCIPIDEGGKVLANTPIWYDTRAEEECSYIKNTVGESEVFSLCKNPIKPSYTTPKALWFKNNHRDIYDNSRWFLQCNSFIVYRLTGEVSQDKSQGYGHFFYDMQNSRYDSSMAEKLGLNIGQYPPIFDCHAIVGKITQKASLQTGLPVGIPVVAGGLDAACGTLGAGVFRSGQTQEQGGQAGGMSICMDKPTAHEKLILGNHVVPDQWLLQGGTVGGGGAMKWFCEQLGNSFASENQLKEIDRQASAVYAGSDGLIFLPYMSGERSPIWNSKAKGVFYGLSFEKTRGHMARAIMEGVGFSLLHNLKTAEEVFVKADTLNAMGGCANSEIWTQIKADITGKPIDVPYSDNATTLGAAILAGVGTGVFKSFEEAVTRTVKIRRHYQPNEQNHILYKQSYIKYLELYERLKEMMV